MTTADTTPWHIVEEHLARTGALVNGVGRRARATRCPHCRAHVLRGMDADIGALDAQVDPTPLSPLGEVLTQLDNRRTYALVSEAGRLVLNHRTAGRITHRPAGTAREDVLAEHRCGSTPPPPAATLPSHHAINRHHLPPPDAPAPF